MNDPTKTIDVDKSSLLSLKAELLRKQEEVSRANINRRLIPQLKTKIKAMKSIEPQNLRQGEYLEDVALINKSKKTLEAKAKFYDKMVSGERTIGENCLVNFEQKRLEARELSDDEDLPSCSKTALDQNLWVEYTDSLGRSRVCLKKDLSSFVQQDKDLNVVSFPAEKDKKVTLSKTINLKPVIDVGLKFQEQRDQWEKQEIENTDKHFVHYQDVLFDEARQHGTGFYSFATDQETRVKQQDDLNNIRNSTLEAQQKRESLRVIRDKVVADRVTAAKARVRARLGLPPENKVEEVLYDKTEEEEKLKMDEIASLIRIKEEKKRDEVRKSHVRPWDEGKSKAKNYDTDSDDSDDNKEWEPKREYEPMSQQQWNEKKRSERSSDFAPPVLESNIPKKPKETLTYSHEISEDAINSYLQAQRLEKSLIFTSKAKPQFKRKNYEAASNSVEDELLPPKVPKLDTPTTSVPFPEVSNDQLEKSIAAGLRFLRDQSDKGDIKNKNIWASRKEY